MKAPQTWYQGPQAPLGGEWQGLNATTPMDLMRTDTKRRRRFGGLRMPGSSTSQRDSRLLSLPTELQDMIWHECAIAEPMTMTKQNRRPQVPPLLHTCREIRRDAMAVWLAEARFNINLVHFDGAWVIDLDRDLSHMAKSTLSRQAYERAAERITYWIDYDGVPNWTNLVRTRRAWCGRLESGPLKRKPEDLTPYDNMVDAVDTLLESNMESPWAEVETLLEICIHRPVAALDPAWA